MRMTRQMLKNLFGTVSALALSHACLPALGADVNITSGTVAYDPVPMAGKTISIDGATARLIIDASHAIANGIDVQNGGTLENHGTLARTGAGEQGFSGSYGHLENYGAISTTTRQGVVFYNGGTILNSGAAASISGADAYGVSIQNASGSVRNEGGAQITGPSAGVIIWQGGDVTNTGAGSRISNGVSVLGAGGTVTNADGAEILGRVVLRGGGNVDNTGAGSAITSTNPNDAAVVLENVATLSNSAGATISGAQQGVYLAEGGTVTNGAGSSITGGTIGVESIGALTLTNSGTITGDATAILGTDTASITNHGTIIATSDRGIDIAGGDVINSGTGALIEAAGIGVFIDGEGEVTNAEGARIVAGGDGVIMYYGGNVTNASGATIDSDATGVLVWDYGTVTNTGAGSAIRTTGNVAVDFAPYDFDGPFILENRDGAVVDAGYAGVRFLGSGSVLNSGANSTISANSYAVFFEEAPGDVVNENGARIVSRHGSGVSLYYGGDVVNRSGGIIEGPVAGIYVHDGTLDLLNTGAGTTIKGDVYNPNGAGTVTNADGARIEGGIRLGSGDVTNSSATIVADDDAIRINGNGTVTNTGTINAGAKAIYLAGGGTVTSTNGSITSGGDGIHLDDDGTVTLSGGTLSSSAKGVLINGEGTVSLANAIITSGSDGIQLTGGGTVSLSGSSLTAGGEAIALDTGGTVTIDGGTVTGGGIAISGDGLMTITNSGTIRADDYAIYSPVDIALTNKAGGHIEGEVIGVYIADGGGTVINEAGATISGQSAIHAFGDTTLVNRGRLEGNVLLARTDLNTVTLQSGSVITGDLEIGDHTSSTLTLTGTGHQLYSDAVLGNTSFASKLIKTGTGTWIVDKAIDATIINIDAGTLIVGVRGNGEVVGTVNVNPGSVISGSGTIYGNLIVDRATVAPGNSPGVLTIVGGYAPGAGSVLEIELDPRNIFSDRVDVIGNAVIDPAAELKVIRIDDNPYTVGTRYTVLTTTTGRNGQFVLTGDLNPSGFLAISDEYDADNVYLVVRQSRNLANAALTANQQAVAGALDAASGTLNARNVALNAADDAAARAIFDDLSGEIHPALARDRLGWLDQLAGTLVDQLRGEETFWIQQHAKVGSVAGDGNGRDAGIASAGLILGRDSSIAPDLRLGLMAGLSGTATGLGRSSGTMSGPVAGLYGAAGPHDTQLRFGLATTLGLAQTKTDLARPGLASATANYAALGGMAFVELAHTLREDAVILEPFAGLGVAGLLTAPFSETGSDLNAAAALHHLATATVGLRLGTTIDLGEQNSLDLDVSAAWRHVLSASRNGPQFDFAGGPAFTTAAAGAPVDTLDLGLGTRMAITDGLSLGLSYNASLSASASSHGARLHLQGSF